MLLFVLIYCFKMRWLPAIALLSQGPRALGRQGEPGMDQALGGFGAKLWLCVALPGRHSEPERTLELAGRRR